LEPDYAEAHCNLGFCLQHRGELSGATAALQRGHELGSRRRHWPYPSAQWVRQCQRLNELAGRLPAFLQGKVQPAGAVEKNDYAQLCYYKKFHVASARLRLEAFTACPKLAGDWKAGHRHEAAAAAALAGAGQGADAGKLGDKERARWRKQALEWLRADLTVYG